MIQNRRGSAPGSVHGSVATFKVGRNIQGTPGDAAFRDLQHAPSFRNLQYRLADRIFDWSQIGAAHIQTVPNFTVDVGPTFETKQAMLAKHQSQRLWLQQQHGLEDYLQQMEDWTRACGARAGILWGEGFRQYKVHPCPQEPLLQQILSQFLANPKN